MGRKRKIKKNLFKLTRAEKIYFVWQYFSIVVGSLILNSSLPTPFFTGKTVLQIGNALNSMGFVIVCILLVIVIIIIQRKFFKHGK